MGKVIGVTGIMGSGKTTLCKRLKGLIKEDFKYISIDEFRRNMKENKQFLNDYLRTVRQTKCSIDYEQMIYREKVYEYLRKQLEREECTVIVDWALIIEDDIINMFDKIILLYCSKSVALGRVKNGDLSLKELNKRYDNQISSWKSKNILKSRGKEFIVLDSEKEIDEKEIERCLNFILEGENGEV